LHRALSAAVHGFLTMVNFFARVARATDCFQTGKKQAILFQECKFVKKFGTDRKRYTAARSTERRKGADFDPLYGGDA
jgi:hypothetical protein